MAEPRTSVRAAAADFTELWRNVTAHSDEAATSTMRTDLRSPQPRSSRYAGCSTGDSPGDVEPSQDIFWDPTSPTPAAGVRNSRFVEISDIVNRIAPKDVKRKASDSPLLQWIGDSAVPWTQGVPKPRGRKRSSRASSVDDLLKLARQFDENMQQDRETSERLAAAGDALGDLADAGAPEPKPQPADARFSGGLKGPPSSDPVEAELRALFDCSTQKVSGRLSQGSSAASARSQETNHRPSAERRQPELEPAGGSGTAEGRGPLADACDDFDDDWDDDDLLDDSFALVTSRDAAPQCGARREASPANSDAFTSVRQPSARPKPKPSALRELCPETKTSNRSTFKLEPNPHFQTTKASGAAARPKPNTSDPKPAAAKTPSIPIPEKTKTSVAAVSSDTPWDDDDGVDDALLYQACDRVERSGNRQSPRAFVRSNSLPGGGGGGGGGGETGSYQGWGVPMKGGDSKAPMSQSLPGSRVSLGSFNRCRDADAAAGTAPPDPKPHAQNHQPACKIGVADSPAVSSKVFISHQKRCSAVEISRKKQEALARRRLRLQSASKP